jgi:hypothetical protein
VKRHGKPIEEVEFSGKSISADITHEQRYLEWEACIAARLDIERWENGGYKKEFMAAAVVWYLDHILVEQHSIDAANSKR